MRKSEVPDHLKSSYSAEKNDLTPEVLKNLEWLGIENLVPIGGDDTLSFAVRLYQEGAKVSAYPKRWTTTSPAPTTASASVPASRARSRCRIICALRPARTSAFWCSRFSGATPVLRRSVPTMAGAANRCVIPEYKFNIEHLTELLVADRHDNPSHYATVLVSEGAMFEGGEMVFERRRHRRVRPQETRGHWGPGLRANQAITPRNSTMASRST